MSFLDYVDNNNYQIKQFKKGDIIYKSGDVCSVISLVKSGEVKAITSMPNNDEKVIRTILHDEYIGLNLVFSSNNIFRANFISECDTTIYEINKDVLIDLMSNDKILLTNVLTILSDSAIKQFDYLALINKKTIRSKFCYYLYKEAKKSNSLELDLPNKTIISSILQIERPSLGLEIKKLIDEGIIENNNKHYKILDINKLTKLF